MPRAQVHLLSAILGGLLLLGVAGHDAIAARFASLYSFCPGGGQCVDGAFPVTGLAVDSSGNLFGVTSSGGTSGIGEIFELSRAGGTYTFQPLHSLGSNEGQDLVTPLIVDTRGNLYGTTEAGGAHSAGTAFELSPDKTRTVWTFQVLYDFCSQGGSACTDGMTPLSRLSYAGASSGALYDGKSPLFGTTVDGGNNAGGTAFQLTRNGSQWSEQVVYNFCSLGACQDGEAPEGDLAIDPKGKLYGTASSGGINSGGVVYRLVPGSGVETVLYKFCSLSQCVDGSAPFAGVAFADSKTLFGTTHDGGANGKGTVFGSTLRGKERVLYSFCKKTDCTDGFNPTGPALDFSGTVIGTIGGGDSFGTGVVYQLVTRKKEKRLHVFCLQFGCVDGTNPEGGLVAFKDHVFGTTQSGGHFGDGTVYEVKP